MSAPFVPGCGVDLRGSCRLQWSHLCARSCMESGLMLFLHMDLARGRVRERTYRNYWGRRGRLRLRRR